MSIEAKVGAFTIAGLALLAGVMIMLSGLKLGGSSGYTLYAGFPQVVGVSPQSTVRLSGVAVGTVSNIANDGGGVTITMQINPDVKIPKGSQVVIGSTGVMGDKFVNILPSEDTGNYLADGDYLIGQAETSMEDLFSGLSKVIIQVQDLLGNMNSIVGNENFKGSVVQMAMNMREATAHIDGMMAALENMAVSNQGNINQMLGNMNAMTASLNRTAEAVEAMMTNLATVGADPQTAENLRLTLDNITAASDKIRVITEGVAKVAGDDQTIADAKAIIHNTRGLTEKAGKLKQKLESIKVKSEADVLYSGAADDWSTNFNINVGQEQGAFMSFGADDLGSDAKANVQIGTRNNSIGGRAGLINGKGGVGFDAYASDNFKFSADAFGVEDTSVRLRAQYRLGNDGTWLMGQWNDVNDSAKRRAYVGLRQTF